MNGVGDLKSILTSDMELQSLEFALLDFGLPLVYIFHYFPFPRFWNGNMYSLPLYVEIMQSAFAILILQRL